LVTFDEEQLFVVIEESRYFPSLVPPNRFSVEEKEMFDLVENRLRW
jgi:hypothetical protein